MSISRRWFLTDHWRVLGDSEKLELIFICFPFLHENASFSLLRTFIELWIVSLKKYSKVDNNLYNLDVIYFIYLLFNTSFDSRGHIGGRGRITCVYTDKDAVFLNCTLPGVSQFRARQVLVYTYNWMKGDLVTQLYLEQLI